MKSNLRAFVAISLLGGLLHTLAWSQPPSPANSTLPPLPAPKKDLPPLKLPDIPGEEMEPGESEPESPEAPWEKETPQPATPPPAPLPIPPGPAVVDSKLKTNQKMLFRIEYDGRLVGYSHFQVTGRMTLVGESSWILKSQSRLKLGVGSKDDSTFESKLMVDTKTLAPTYFQAQQVAGGGKFEVVCLYSKTMVAQTNSAGNNTQQHFHSYEGEVPKLLFNNLWGHLDTFPEHYWLLVRSAVKGGTIKAYDPILRGGGQLVVYQPKAEKWKLDKQEFSTLVYPISDMEGTMLARVRVESKSLELLEVDEVGSGILIKRSGPSVLAEVEKIKPLDLLPRRMASSNVIFPEPEKLTNLEAEIDLSLRGGNLVDHQIAGYRQYFNGEISDGHMKGRVVVRSVPSDAVHKTKFPFRKEDVPPPEIATYLQAGPGVESDWDPLRNKAVELCWKSDSTFAAARKLLNFCTQVEEGVSLPSARYALESSVGNPQSKALLLVALARAAGLPARPVGGLLYREGTFVPHHWAEIWLGQQEGWSAFDPTTLEAGRIGAAHIALWNSGDIQSMNVKILNYAPRAPRRVAFFNRELSWGVGEERIYEILRKGKKIGEEVAAVREIMVSGDEEVYRFESITKITDGLGLDSTSELLVNPNGLPVKFSLKGVKGKLQNQSFLFKKDTAQLETEVSEGHTTSKEIPFSYGTYFTDSRFLSQWALVLGQALDESPEKQPKVGDKLTFHTFVPDSMKSQEIVLEVREPETLKVSDEVQIEVTRLEAETGMAFLLNDKHQVVKIEVPEQNLDFQLVDTKFSTK
jgi:hypothetical protein